VLKESTTTISSAHVMLANALSKVRSLLRVIM
jgi:hypothetical protein